MTVVEKFQDISSGAPGKGIEKEGYVVRKGSKSAKHVSKAANVQQVLQPQVELDVDSEVDSEVDSQVDSQVDSEVVSQAVAEMDSRMDSEAAAVQASLGAVVVEAAGDHPEALAQTFDKTVEAGAYTRPLLSST